jgi:hypothetical protein
VLVVDDYRVIFERKIPFEFNLNDPDVTNRVGYEVTSNEDVIVKILVKVKTNSLLSINRYV